MAKRASRQELDPTNDEAEEARLEIERTRAQMGETLDSIGDRLSPERFKTEAVEVAGRLKDEAIDTADHLKTAAVEAARAATQEVITGVREATWGAYDSARSRVNQTKLEIEGAGMSVIKTVKNNPIPAAMVGMGLYWLYQSMQETQRFDLRPSTAGHLRSRAGQAGDAMGRVKDSLSEAASKAGTRAGELGDAAMEKAQEVREAAGERLEHYSEALQDGGQRAADEFQYLLKTSPLAVAGVAAAIGLAFGMMLPESEVENRTMGVARDQFVGDAHHKVTEVVSDLADKAVDLKDQAAEVAGAMTDAARGQIQQSRGTN